MLSVQILHQNATEERGEAARLSSFVGAIAIGDLVKSTLGPKGMVKNRHRNGQLMKDYEDMLEEVSA
uniref:T-complex protein 1 subunit beta n=1 Tax=Steinernema glaseri TaxID=37863 RepID=A0A1I7ZS83_9BILA